MVVFKNLIICTTTHLTLRYFVKLTRGNITFPDFVAQECLLRSLKFKNLFAR